MPGRWLRASADEIQRFDPNDPGSRALGYEEFVVRPSFGAITPFTNGRWAGLRGSRSLQQASVTLFNPDDPTDASTGFGGIGSVSLPSMSTVHSAYYGGGRFLVAWQTHVAPRISRFNPENLSDTSSPYGVLPAAGPPEPASRGSYHSVVAIHYNSFDGHWYTVDRHYNVNVDKDYYRLVRINPDNPADTTPPYGSLGQILFAGQDRDVKGLGMDGDLWLVNDNTSVVYLNPDDVTDQSSPYGFAVSNFRTHSTFDIAFEPGNFPLPYTDTDRIYMLASSSPSTPSGGNSDALYLPVGGWSRVPKMHTTSQGLWESTRQRQFRGDDLVEAGNWTAPKQVAAPLPAGGQSVQSGGLTVTAVAGGLWFQGLLPNELFGYSIGRNGATPASSPFSSNLEVNAAGEAYVPLKVKEGGDPVDAVAYLVYLGELSIRMNVWSPYPDLRVIPRDEVRTPDWTVTVPLCGFPILGGEELVLPPSSLIGTKPGAEQIEAFWPDTDAPSARIPQRSGYQLEYREVIPLIPSARIRAQVDAPDTVSNGVVFNSE